MILGDYDGLACYYLDVCLLLCVLCGLSFRLYLVGFIGLCLFSLSVLGWFGLDAVGVCIDALFSCLGDFSDLVFCTTLFVCLLLCIFVF